MTRPKKIVLTGGGSAGHVIPNLALRPLLQEAGWEMEYIGSYEGIEKELVGKLMPYHGISSGKLRRYFDIKNFSDIFRVALGTLQAYRLLKKINPRIVFSKGGFVAVPVVVGAWLNRIPVFLHEADITPGLANKLSMPFAEKIFYSFPETKSYLPADKCVYTGLPVREELKKGDRRKGLTLCGFSETKPVALIMGGSLGAETINKTVWEALDLLLEEFQVAHICGKGKADLKLSTREGYKQFEYLKDEYPHVMAAADVVLSRAGANSIFEILALKIPSLLLPLSKQASRGDQILNARSFTSQGFSRVLYDEALDPKSLVQETVELYKQRKVYIQNMNSYQGSDSAAKILAEIEKYA
ncbi:undecaprenyldiphospho-muramoylpentapeptide beta-N-acetylglucosaminyltransferase [Fibrobacterota bacterium]